MIRIYESEGCAGCPLFKECRNEKAKPDTNRRVQFSKKLEAYKEQAKALLATEKGKQKRSQRSVDVETPFGDIKYNMGHKRFILRGIEKVTIEFTLLAIAHNLRKVHCQKTGIWKDYYAQRASRKK
jgi:IS5 family transposase